MASLKLESTVSHKLSINLEKVGFPVIILYSSESDGLKHSISKNYCMSKCNYVQNELKINHRPKYKIQNYQTPLMGENLGDLGFSYVILEIISKVHMMKEKINCISWKLKTSVKT